MTKSAQSPSRKELKIMKGNFTQVPNHCLEDSGISFAAKGLLSYMLSKPLGWQFYVENLSKQSANGSLTKVRRYLKELTEQGYLIFGKHKDTKTNRFKGSGYILNVEVIEKKPLNKPSEFVSGGSRKTRFPENSNVGKSDVRESSDLNKKEFSNTNFFKNKNHQQQANLPNGVDVFFSDLKKDKVWLESFTHEKINGRIITVHDVELLLFQFREIAVKKAESYQDGQAVKKHFLNWFNHQKDRNRLDFNLLQQQNKQRHHLNKAHGFIATLDQIMAKRKGQLFSSEHEVEIAKQEIQVFLKSVGNLMNYIRNEEAVNALSEWMEEADKISHEIDRAKAKKELKWFCQNGNPSINSPSNPNETIS